jgi:hypothetical protein
VPDFLADTRYEIDSRLKELQPAVDEYDRVQAAAEALAKIPGPSNGASTPPGRRGPGRPPGSKNPRAGGTKPAKVNASKAKAPRKAAGRRKGGGKRSEEALAFVKSTPGITIPKLAAKMGIKQNYLYRVLPSLEKEKLVEKQGRGWHPTANAAKS